MKRNNIPEAIGIVVSVGGALVMAGWLLDIEIVKNPFPGTITMKFPTALSFLLSGITLYFSARFRKKDREWAYILIPIAGMILFLLMSSMLASMVLGLDTGIEEMFVDDPMAAVGSVTPGRPSVATMAAFLLIGLAGAVTTLNFKGARNALTLLGLEVAAIGTLAILGYAMNQPLLYFAVQGKSSAMAVNTAVLFFLWGIGAALTERDK